MAPPFRADHIGSLYRPPELMEALTPINALSNTYMVANEENIKEATAKAIDDAVRLQVKLQIRPICSGEYTRIMFYSGIFEKLDGFSIQSVHVPDAIRTDFPTTSGWAKLGYTKRVAAVCTAPIKWQRSAYMEEWRMLRNTLDPGEWKDCKITMPSPTFQHVQLKEPYTKSSGYTSDQEYFKDLCEAYLAEIRELYKEGVRKIQIDDPHLTYFCSPVFLGGCEKDGVDTDVLLDTYMHAHNYILQRKPKDLQMSVHLCRGNSPGGWVTGSYENIARKLFQNVDYKTYYLEFNDEKHTGGFEPLRFLPREKNAVLGVLSTKTAELEDKAKLKDKVIRACNVIADAQGVSYAQALESLAVSPQCGFASGTVRGKSGMAMDSECMWAKLVLLRDLAREIWTDAI